MPHVNFDVNTVKWSDFFQEGDGRVDVYFEGVPYQRGWSKDKGVGSVFRRLYRVILPVLKAAGPVLKAAAPVLKKEGLETTARILNNVAEGVPTKEAIVSEVKEGAKNIAKKVVQSGGRRKRKRSRKPKELRGRLVPKNTARKKRRVDTFGFY